MFILKGNVLNTLRAIVDCAKKAGCPKERAREIVREHMKTKDEKLVDEIIKYFIDKKYLTFEKANEKHDGLYMVQIQAKQALGLVP